MSLATLDTHEVVKDLQSAGFTDAQAEAGARNIPKAQDLDLSPLWPPSPTSRRSVRT